MQNSQLIRRAYEIVPCLRGCVEQLDDCLWQTVSTTVLDPSLDLEYLCNDYYGSDLLVEYARTEALIERQDGVMGNRLTLHDYDLEFFERTGFNYAVMKNSIWALVMG